jgi:cold shock protein
MSEIDRPANAKPVTESVLTEIRRPRLLRLSPDMLRGMAERTKRTKELDGSGRQSLHQPNDGTARPRINGRVKFFNTDRGFGFIVPDGGGSDVFVHAHDVEVAGMKTLVEGQLVAYEVGPARDGRSKAVNLRSFNNCKTPHFLRQLFACASRHIRGDAASPRMTGASAEEEIDEPTGRFLRQCNDVAYVELLAYPSRVN